MVYEMTLHTTNVLFPFLVYYIQTVLKVPTLGSKSRYPTSKPSQLPTDRPMQSKVEYQPCRLNPRPSLHCLLRFLWRNSSQVMQFQLNTAHTDPPQWFSRFHMDTSPSHCFPLRWRGAGSLDLLHIGQGLACWALRRLGVPPGEFSAQFSKVGRGGSVN